MKKRTRLPFTGPEDELLLSYINKYGEDWNAIAKEMPWRTIRQCRDRYNKYLKPDINRNPFTEEEDAMLKNLIKKHGKQWARIGKILGNRTDIIVKKRWAELEKNKEAQITDGDTVREFGLALDNWPYVDNYPLGSEEWLEPL